MVEFCSFHVSRTFRVTLIEEDIDQPVAIENRIRHICQIRFTAVTAPSTSRKTHKTITELSV